MERSRYDAKAIQSDAAWSLGDCWLGQRDFSWASRTRDAPVVESLNRALSASDLRPVGGVNLLQTVLRHFEASEGVEDLARLFAPYRLTKQQPQHLGSSEICWGCGVDPAMGILS